jgi:bacterioferritin
MHAQKFQRMLDKLTPEEAAGVPGEENELPQDFVDKLQDIVSSKYTQVLQHVRDGWVFQDEGITGWEVMDFSMTQMKQLAHVAEEVAENGIPPRFDAGQIDIGRSIGAALQNTLENVRASRERHLRFRAESETQKHAGLITSLDLTLQQEEYEAAEIEGWIKKL